MKYIVIAIAIVLLLVGASILHNGSALTNGRFTESEQKLNRRLDSLENLMRAANIKLDSLDMKIDHHAKELRAGQQAISRQIDSLANRQAATFKLW